MHEHIAIRPVADIQTTAGVIGKIVGADFEKDRVPGRGVIERLASMTSG